MKLLGVVIANGFSPEARVFASLLRERKGRYQSLVLHHDPPNPHPKDAGAPDDFERAAKSPVVRFDAGWRRNDEGQRSLPAKIGSRAMMYAQLPRLVLEARRYQPDLVYSSQQHWDSGVAGTLARALRKPQVVHLHYTVGPWLGRSALRALSGAEGVVCVSEFIGRQARAHGVPDDRLCVIPNTLRVPPALPDGTRASVRRDLRIADEASVFTFVARLAEGKGHADALEAFAMVAPENPDAHLLVVGDGPLRSSLESLAHRLSLGERARFLGFRRDVNALLTASDAFVHPSRDEPFGLSILEAAALGLPTIAYRDAGPSEIVQDGETGILAPLGDKKALAAAMARLIREPDPRRMMGNRARSDVETRFAPERQADRFADFLLRVSTAGRSTRG